MNNPFEVIEARLSSIEDLILDLKHPSETVVPSVNEPDLITPKEAADLLKVSSVTLWRYEKQGKVKCYGIGGRRLYKRSEVMDALVPKK